MAALLSPPHISWGRRKYLSSTPGKEHLSTYNILKRKFPNSPKGPLEDTIRILYPDLVMREFLTDCFEDNTNYHTGMQMFHCKEYFPSLYTILKDQDNQGHQNKLHIRGLPEIVLPESIPATLKKNCIILFSPKTTMDLTLIGH